MLDILSVMLDLNDYVWISATSHFASVHMSTHIPKVSHRTTRLEMTTLSSLFPIR